MLSLTGGAGAVEVVHEVLASTPVAAGIAGALINVLRAVGAAVARPAKALRVTTSGALCAYCVFPMAWVVELADAHDVLAMSAGCEVAAAAVIATL